MTTITKLHLNWSDYDIGAPENVKVFTLSSTSDLVNAQAAYDWWANWWVPIVKLGDFYHSLLSVTATNATFYRIIQYWAVSSGTWIYTGACKFTISSWSVTAVTGTTNTITISSSAPSSATNSTITLVI